MELIKNIPAFHPKTRKAWRRWLEKNHEKEKAVWLIIYHRSSKVKSVSYEAGVEEALCFGWIDSIRIGRDDESHAQYFAPRKKNSKWAGTNKARVERLIKAGLMTESGMKHIVLAKQTGMWDALTDVENLVVPDDLQKLFDKNKTAFKNFNAFSASAKKLILNWITDAKRPETRKNRIKETVKLAKDNIKAR